MMVFNLLISSSIFVTFADLSRLMGAGKTVVMWSAVDETAVDRPADDGPADDGPADDGPADDGPSAA